MEKYARLPWPPETFVRCWREFDRPVITYKVTLGRDCDDYVFAFEVSSREYEKDSNIVRARLDKAVQVLRNDWQKLNG